MTLYLRMWFFFSLSFQQQHLRKWMEVVVITHKGGQRSDGNVSD